MTIHFSTTRKMYQHILSILFFGCCCSIIVHGDQPYFPSDIVFTIDNGQRLYAIDSTNQRAFVSINDSSPQNVYVYEHFPYSPVDTPQSNYYVQLATSVYSNHCVYATYWPYGGNGYNYFPSHWNKKNISFEIGNYLNSNYQLIHSTNHSEADEDYWYSNQLCYDAIEDRKPCFRIYFKKNTEIPLRSIELELVSNRPIFQPTEYEVVSIGKPDDKYFAGINKHWYRSCIDVNLQVFYFADRFVVSYEHYQTVGVSLHTPPHRINGNDSVIIQWSIASGCDRCLTWTPQQLTFNSENFNQIQNLTFYRVYDSMDVICTPIFIGGGFDLVLPDRNSIHFEPS